VDIAPPLLLRTRQGKAAAAGKAAVYHDRCGTITFGAAFGAGIVGGVFVMAEPERERETTIIHTDGGDRGGSGALAAVLLLVVVLVVLFFVFGGTRLFSHAAKDTNINVKVDTPVVGNH
jgi:hypothetical protein